METLNHFYKFVYEILSDNSRNYKIDILNNYKDDEIIKYYLNYIYNPYLITGISDKKIRKYSDDDVIMHHPVECSVKELLEDILKNNTGKDDMLLTIANFKYFNLSYQFEDVNDEDDVEDLWGDNYEITSDNNIEDDDWLARDDETIEMSDAMRQEEVDKEHINELRELLDKIITKNLNLGIDVKTINKCMPGLIPEFNVMLANRYFDKPEIVEGKEFALTTKIDGGRIIAIKKNGVAKFYTRQGQEYESLVDLKAEMEKYFPDNICLDGEITLLNPGELTSKDQYKQTMKITRKDGEKHEVKMKVFDCMTAEEFGQQKCERSYSNRRLMLYDIFTSADTEKDVELRLQGSFLRGCDKFPQYFELLPVLYEGEDTSMISKILDEQIAEGEEGIMINICDAPYDFKRTNNLLKVKKMDTLDLRVIRLEKGHNKYSNTLGSIVVSYKGNEVGAGISFGEGSDKLRDYYWTHPEEIVGKIVEIQYFEETESDGVPSLRFPVVKNVRTDKSEADY